MSFRDYSLTPSGNNTIGDEIYIGPNMARNDVREALQTLAADGRELFDLAADLTTQGAERYNTKAAAEAAVAGLDEGLYVEVLVDESEDGLRTLYQNVSGVLVFKVNLSAGAAAVAAAEAARDEAVDLLEDVSAALALGTISD